MIHHHGDGNSLNVDARVRLEPKRGTSGTKTTEPFSYSSCNLVISTPSGQRKPRQRALSLKTPHERSTTKRLEDFQLSSMAHLQGMDPATKRDRVVRVALVEGFKAAFLSGGLSSAAVYAAHQYSPWFRRSTNVSAKAALAVSPFFLAFYLRSELVLHGANTNPRAYGIVADGEVPSQAETGPKISMLSLPRQAANFLYQNPLHMIVGMGIPTVGAIMWSVRKEKHLTFSQKVMHTRVMGQMSIVGMLVITMAFRETMKRSGGLFVEEAEEEAEGGVASVR